VLPQAVSPDMDYFIRITATVPEWRLLLFYGLQNQ